MLRVLRAGAALAAAVAAVAGLAGCSDDVSVFRADVGDCMVRPPEGEVEGLDVIDCNREHLGEIVGIVEHEDVEFPGAAQLSAEAFERCRPLLEAYIGDPELADDFGIVPLSPTEESWNAELADRESLCIAVPVDLAPFTGSLRDLEPPATTTTAPGPASTATTDGTAG